MAKNIHNLLIIDDNEIDRFIIETLLNTIYPELGIQQASHGREALQLLDCCERFPDLIFLDINMPFMNGFEFLDKWSLSKHKGMTEIILVSSSHLEEDREKALACADVTGFIEKPVSIKALEGAIFRQAPNSYAKA